MLLKIYLGSTIINLSMIALTSVAYSKRLKREGYMFIKNDNSFPEKLLSLIKTVITASLPVLNTLNAISLIFIGETNYQKLKSKLISEGKIYIPVEHDEELLKNTEEYFGENTKVKYKKTYNEMTLEEKLNFLEKEKERLIREANYQEDVIIKKRKK